MLNRVLLQYRLPFSIEGETAGNACLHRCRQYWSRLHGFFSRAIMSKSPAIRICTRSNGRSSSSGDESGEGNSLAIRNYRFGCEREIGGSVGYRPQAGSQQTRPGIPLDRRLQPRRRCAAANGAQRGLPEHEWWRNL